MLTVCTIFGCIALFPVLSFAQWAGDIVNRKFWEKSRNV